MTTFADYYFTSGEVMEFGLAEIALIYNISSRSKSMYM